MVEVMRVLVKGLSYCVSVWLPVLSVDITIRQVLHLVGIFYFLFFIFTFCCVDRDSSHFVGSVCSHDNSPV